MKKLLLILFGICLLASGCVMSDQEVNKRYEEYAKSAAVISKTCKEAGMNIGIDINGNYYCKP